MHLRRLPYRRLALYTLAPRHIRHQPQVRIPDHDQGCVLAVGDEYAEARGYKVQVVDTVGAGDAFAAAFMHGWNAGWAARDIADFANRVGALVASRAGAIP